MGFTIRSCFHSCWIRREHRNRSRRFWRYRIAGSQRLFIFLACNGSPAWDQRRIQPFWWFCSFCEKNCLRHGAVLLTSFFVKCNHEELQIFKPKLKPPEKFESMARAVSDNYGLLYPFIRYATDLALDNNGSYGESVGERIDKPAFFIPF